MKFRSAPSVVHDSFFRGGTVVHGLKLFRPSRHRLFSVDALVATGLLSLTVVGVSLSHFALSPSLPKLFTVPEIIGHFVPVAASRSPLFGGGCRPVRKIEYVL